MTVLRKVALKILNRSRSENATVEIGNETPKLMNSENIEGERNANGNKAITLK